MPVDSSRMKILITTAWFPKGNSTSGIFVKEQAEALAKRGHEVTVFLLTYSSFGNALRSLFSSTGESFESSGRVVVLHKHVVLPFYFRWLRDKDASLRSYLINAALNCVVGYYGDRKPDLVHHHCLSDNSFLAQAMALHFNIPYFFTEHSPYTTDNELKKFNTFETAESRRTFVQHAATCIAVSSYWAETYTHIYNRKYKVVPNLVSEYFEGPLLSKGISPFVFTIIAGVDRNKRQLELIDQFAQTFSRRKDVQLVIAGAGPLLEQCRNAARNSAASDQISLVGKLNRTGIRDLLNRSHCVLLVSEKETFGIVLAEAMFRGLPVIATRSGGPEEFVTQENGYLIDGLEDLPAAMMRMMENYLFFDSGKIQRNAVERFSEEAVCEQLELIYKTELESFKVDQQN